MMCTVYLYTPFSFSLLKPGMLYLTFSFGYASESNNNKWRYCHHIFLQKMIFIYQLLDNKSDFPALVVRIHFQLSNGIGGEAIWSLASRSILCNVNIWTREVVLLAFGFTTAVEEFLLMWTFLFLTPDHWTTVKDSTYLWLA